MPAASPTVWRPALTGLIAFHILIIIASNYLVQLPITLFGWHTTWGAFSFPFIFLATDLTVRLLGKSPARQVIARVMIPALVASYVVSVVFQEGAFRGLGALGDYNEFVLRISVASFLAYVLGQVLDEIIVTTEFRHEAEVQKAALGMAELQPVVIQHPLSTLTDDEIGARAADAAAQAVKIWLGQR